MKQGTGNNSSRGQKREPIVHAVNPKFVATIGVSQYTQPEPEHQGRGFSAPSPKGVTQHHCGSQGKHK